MSNRIFDASQIIKRKGQQAVAGSFISRISPWNALSNATPQMGAAPLLGVYDNSIISQVKLGGMTEITRYPTCIGISPGCPCPQVNASLIDPPYRTFPGYVSGITFTVGSVIVSWNPPTTGTAPFTYTVTPYLNGNALTPVSTSDTTYRFTNLVDNTPYTFTVCAVNSLGAGPNTPGPSTFVSPPNTLSAIMAGSTIPQDPVPALIYVLNAGLDSMLNYVAGQNVGPTRGSRLLYLWVTTMVGAWNWVSSDSRITGVKDNWNWTNNKVTPSLSSNDCVVWMMCVVDYITPILIPGPYTSIYNCPTGSSVQSLGNWSGWQSAWQAWYNYRQNDGYVAASTAQPTASANWNNTIVVDGTTVTNIAGFPEPDQWTRLTVGGKKQGYLTWTWDNVLSSCLSNDNEATILSTIGPYMATDSTTPSRNNEIDDVLSYSGALTDQQKMWAEFWSGGQPGLTSPPLMFIWLWKEYMRSIMSTGTLTTANIVFSLQDLAVHLFEGARVIWMLKSHFFQDRPIQEIRKRYVGQNVRSWNGTSDGSQWLPYQMSNSVTPAFADFPSGHSHFSKAFALTMTKWFGGAIRKNPVTYDGLPVNCIMFSQDQTGNYGDFVIPAGASRIEPGATPSAPLTISLTTWDDTSATANPTTAISTQAGVSRLYGGIHALSAHLGSQACATEVHGYINSTWNIRTI